MHVAVLDPEQAPFQVQPPPAMPVHVADVVFVVQLVVVLHWGVPHVQFLR